MISNNEAILDEYSQINELAAFTFIIYSGKFWVPVSKSIVIWKTFSKINFVMYAFNKTIYWILFAFSKTHILFVCYKENEAEAQRIDQENKEEKRRLKQLEKDRRREQFLTQRQDVMSEIPPTPGNTKG